MAESSTKLSYPPGCRVSVLLPLPLEGAYDYEVGEDLELEDGDFVVAPLGRRQAAGVVWGPGKGETAAGKLRQISRKFDSPPLPAESRALVDWVSAYTLALPGLVLKMAMSVPAALEPPAPTSAYLPADTFPDVRPTKARKQVMALLADGAPRTAADIARDCGVGPSVVRGLIKAGALRALSLAAEASAPTPNWTHPTFPLSDAQESAASNLEEKTARGGFSVTLLDGVPGSGKTEVYFRAVARALEKGLQALVMVPEIALTAQWLKRFQERFGVEPAIWHSELSPARRRRTWRAVAKGSAKVVIGARSALFLPYPNLGVVVIDEEHDAAFKQEDGVIYNARDMAVVRGRLGSIPVALVSATPSLETAVNAHSGRYGLLHLPKRHSGAAPPDVSLIDLTRKTPARGRWLSPPLIEALVETFEAGEQAMLFLNRRGYAPLTLCRHCGHRLRCPRCTAWLVEHRRQGRLVCHHCGFNRRSPEACPECKTEGTLAACGPGVERLAEEAAELFPTKRIVLAASDTIAGPAAAAELVRRIEEHDVDLVIGTQIVAKGYHFPLLTLVGVVDADLGLSGGDLRAAERTFQLLYQVAGRAGRADRPGRALLQTVMPEHPVMAAMASGDKERFIKAESAARQAASMPPFGRLAALVVSGRDEAAVKHAAQDLSRAAPRLDGVRILGPAPAPLALLRGRRRWRLLLAAHRGIAIQPVIRSWLMAAAIPRNIRVQVDIDPYSFL